MPENNGKKEQGRGILDAPPKTTFVMGLLVGVVVCAIVGVVLSLTVLQTKSSSSKNTNTTADDNANSNTNAVAEDPLLTATAVASYASAIKLDISKFNTCVNGGDKATVVTAQATEGQNLGVQGTPATFVNGYLVSGAIPLADFESIINEVLAGKTPTSQYAEKTAKDVKVTDSDHVTGADNAKVTLVVYADFQCPYCKTLAATMQQIMKDYAGKIRMVYRQFPLSFHPQAEFAAEVSECAADQGKFWEMHDYLFGLTTI